MDILSPIYVLSALLGGFAGYFLGVIPLVVVIVVAVCVAYMVVSDPSGGSGMISVFVAFPIVFFSIAAIVTGCVVRIWPMIGTWHDWLLR